MGIEEGVTKPSDVWRLPTIQTPWTRMGDHWLSYQGTACEDVELDYMRCAAPVGSFRANTVCKDFIEDMFECVNHTKGVSLYF